MVVLSVADYQRIVVAIRSFKGLWIDCDKHIQRQFPEMNSVMISSIVAREGQSRVKQHYHVINKDIRRILADYNRRVQANGERICDDILLGLAAEMKFAPISLSRLILGEKYKDRDKKEIQEMVKNPNIIPDFTLALNVLKCQMNDNLDGPITDSIRRFIGEEYELLVSILHVLYDNPLN